MLVLENLLISAEQVAGGIFTPADPAATDKEKQVASLTLMTLGGPLTVTDDAACFLFNYLVEHHGTKIDKAQAGSITISKEAVSTLAKFFNDFTGVPGQVARFNSCKAIIDTLAQRII